MLNKKIVFLSILSAILMITIGFSSAIAKNTTTKSEKIVFETKVFNGLRLEKNLVELSIEESEEIKQILLDLDEAIRNNDEESILKYKTILKEYGIIDEMSSRFILPQNTADLLNNDVSNSMCYFHAVGSGLIIFPIEQEIFNKINAAARNTAEQTDNPLAKIIIYLVVFILLFVLFCLPVIIFTRLIPFRIMVPSATVQLQEGRMWTRGAQGYKEVTTDDETISVELSYFTGVTISMLPFSFNSESEEDNERNSFMFASGFAFKVELSE